MLGKKRKIYKEKDNKKAIIHIGIKHNFIEFFWGGVISKNIRDTYMWYKYWANILLRSTT